MRSFVIANPHRFWGWYFGIWFGTFAAVDLLAAEGIADGDTACEVLASLLDTTAKQAAALVIWGWLTHWLPRHIMKDREARP